MAGKNFRNFGQQGLENSQIRVLDALFRTKCPDYRLVDYGPLDSSQLKAD